MVEVEIVRRGNRKVQSLPKTKLELLKFPLFRRNSYSYNEGRLDAEWREIQEADFLICIARFNFSMGAAVRVTAKEDLIFIPLLLSGDVQLDTDNGKSFDVFSLQFSLLTLEKGRYLRIANNGTKGFLVLLALQRNFFTRMKVVYHAAERIIDGSYDGYRRPFLLMGLPLRQLMKYTLTLLTVNYKIDNFKVSSTVQTMMAMMLTDIDRCERSDARLSGYQQWQVDLIQKIEDYLRENFEQFPGMEAITKMAAGMSLTTFRKVFADITGSGVYAYWDNHRMELAWDWLSTKQYKPIQVAVILGFASSQAFNKQFKKHYDVAPSRVYRKKA